MRLSNQVSLLVLGSAILSMLVASVYFSFGLRDVLLQQKLESLERQMYFRVQTFNTHIRQLKDDVSLLSENLVVKMWLKNNSSMQSSFEEILSDEFYNFLDSRPHYFQIRLLSPEGEELIRLNKTATTIEKVLKESLQDKSGRYYINAIQNITPTTVWLSPIDLNHEFGLISTPEKITIRAAKLISDEDANILGIIIINMDTGAFLKSISENQENSLIFIINKSGEFLTHPNPAFTFANDRNHTKLLSTMYPELNYAITYPLGTSSKTIDLSGQEYIFQSHQFDYDELNPENNIRIIHLYEKSAFKRSTNLSIRKYLAYTSLLLLSIMLLSLLMSRRIRNRLQKLNRVVDLVNQNKKAEIDIKNPADEIDDILLIFKDMLEKIDDREQSLLTSERRIQTILNTVLNGVITISTSGEIIAINQYGATIFGYEPKDLIGRNINLVIPEKVAKVQNGFLQNYLPDARKHIINKKRELYGKSRDGRLFPVSLAVSELFFDGALHLVGAIDDISDRLENEKKISSYSRQLERSNKELEQFAYMASHDLQEPARKVESFSSLLLITESENMSEEGKEILKRNMRSARRMRDLIISVLALSRIDKVSLSEIEVNLNEILDAALEDLQNTIKSKNAVIQSESLPHIRGDKVQLTQLFVNLIGNSLKFVEDHIQPQVFIKAYTQLAKDNETILAQGFCVEDNGIGIAPENRESVFKPFKRLNNGLKYDGFGIGLALCQRIMEYHNGKITIEENEPKGTRFIVLFEADD